MSSHSPASPHSQPLTEPVLDEMEINGLFTDEEPSTLWDWGELLDFTTHDQPIAFPFDSDHHQVSTFPAPAVMHPLPGSPVTSEGSDRVRKRDPRLTCENFLAGRVPCACPEMDAKIAEEEEAERESERGKKKAKTVRAAPGTAKCQVPGCEVDIRELKGYHRRHRVCLKCANASQVLIHEEIKRYCQQCGKFHILSDFDEGKRSCRRKLERHNNRRRRKSIDSKCSLEQETQDDTLNNTVSCDVEVETDKLCLSDPVAEKDSLFEAEDGHVSAFCPAPSSHNLQESVITFNPSGTESQLNGGKDDSKNTLSTLSFDNKSAYSSTCPTGRISFKLYDWNPAEFPRRLRHQIFHWLSSMPVELEGYIRPGCTILTAFVSMPQIMWDKLLEHHASYLHDFVVSPGSMLSGKGSVLVYINDMRFLVLKDRTSVIKIKEEVKAPRIHYVHPVCFEAGKAMEFVACGSNISQPKFRFLVSFSGKYLENECFLSHPHGKSNEGFSCSIEHQLFKINVPYTQSNLCGPAFIEVENESGFSNFIPILIGDKEVCSEMKKIHRRFETSLCSKGSHFAANSCEASVLRWTLLSDFIADIAWLVKEPTLDSIENSLLPLQIQRYNCLLNILISNNSTVILQKVIRSLKNLMDRMKYPSHCTCDVDLTLFWENVKHAEDILSETMKNQWDSVQKSCFKSNMHQFVPTSNQCIDTRSDVQAMTGSPSFDRAESLPLLKRDVTVTACPMKKLPKQSITQFISTTNRPTIFVIAFAVICFGICAILIHPRKASKFVVSIKRCLFDNQ